MGKRPNVVKNMETVVDIGINNLRGENNDEIYISD